MYRKERQEKFVQLFKVLDLVLLDFKHSNETGHKNLTGLGQKHVLEFARVLEEKKDSNDRPPCGGSGDHR